MTRKRKKIQKMKRIALISFGAGVFGFCTVCIVMANKSIADSDKAIADADAWYEDYMRGRKEYAAALEEHNRNAEAAAIDMIEDVSEKKYPWELEMCGKVVGFEVGLCCDQCKYYVASACVNRMHYWYDDKPIAMITDYSEETGYYMMWPGYAYEDEFYGYSFTAHYEEIMPYVWRAEKYAADIWYWDCADTQGEWADLVWYCPDDDMYFYR